MAVGRVQPNLFVSFFDPSSSLPSCSLLLDSEATLIALCRCHGLAALKCWFGRVDVADSLPWWSLSGRHLLAAQAVATQPPVSGR